MHNICNVGGGGGCENRNNWQLGEGGGGSTLTLARVVTLHLVENGNI